MMDRSVKGIFLSGFDSGVGSGEQGEVLSIKTALCLTQSIDLLHQGILIRAI